MRTPIGGEWERMRIIVIETSSLQGEIALADEGGLLACAPLTAARKHARDVAPLAKELLERDGGKTDDIDLILVDIGPGSYTGLRVGLMTAKSFAYATGAPVIGIDAMTALAEDAPYGATTICPMVDAQQGLIYTAVYQRHDDQPPTRAKDIQITSVEEWAQQLAPGTYITGPALERFAHLVPESCRLAPKDEWNPTARGLFAAGMRAYAAGVRDDAWTLEPLYLRPSAAELKWDQRHAE